MTIDRGATLAFGMHWDSGWTGIAVIAARPMTFGTPLAVSRIIGEMEVGPDGYEWQFQVKNVGTTPAAFQLEAATF